MPKIPVLVHIILSFLLVTAVLSSEAQGQASCADLFTPAQASLGTRLKSLFKSKAKRAVEAFISLNPHISPVQAAMLLEFVKSDILRAEPLRVSELGLVREFMATDELPSRVRPASSSEMKIVEMSQVESDPHEVLRIVAHTKSGHKITSDPIWGEVHRIHIGQAQIFQFINSVISGRYQISSIELPHSHPLYDFKIGQGKVKINPLSHEDLQFALAASARLPGIPVTIEAIVPNGYTYHATFLNGARVQ